MIIYSTSFILRKNPIGANANFITIPQGKKWHLKGLYKLSIRAFSLESGPGLESGLLYSSLGRAAPPVLVVIVIVVVVRD